MPPIPGDPDAPDAREPDAWPPPLVDAIGGLRLRGLDVPAAVDAAILAAARERLAARPAVLRRRFALRRAAASLAAAAALVLAIVFASGRGASGDVDGNGRVDVLDALVLARRIEGGGRLEPRWDLDASGAVDGRDVDAIAARVVSLGPR